MSSSEYNLTRVLLGLSLCPCCLMSLLLVDDVSNTRTVSVFGKAVSEVRSEVGQFRLSLFLSEASADILAAMTAMVYRGFLESS